MSRATELELDDQAVGLTGKVISIHHRRFLSDSKLAVTDEGDTIGVKQQKHGRSKKSGKEEDMSLTRRNE